MYRILLAIFLASNKNNNNMQKFAQCWARELGCSVKQFLGNGDNGEAFELSDGSVIKITLDAAEYELCKGLVGCENDNVADIYQVIEFDEHTMGIWQEKLTLDPDISHLFEELEVEAMQQGCEIEAIDNDCLFGEISFGARDLLDAIVRAIQEIACYGFDAGDVHFSNMGRKLSGEYALFDQRSRR